MASHGNTPAAWTEVSVAMVGFVVGSALSATVLEAATARGETVPPSDGYAAIAVIGVLTCLVLAVLTAVLPAPSPAPSQRPAPARDVAAR